MKKIIVLILFFIQFSAFSQESERIVLLKTNLGNIEIKLFNETPKHRDNFLKLVESHLYDSLLFHRVIDDFMIQTGDPNSKHAKPGEMLGNGGLEYTIDAEILPKYFHRNGALAAARQGNEVNPDKKSSSTQFYIVNGPVYSSEVIDKMETSMKNMKKSEIFTKFLSAKENKVIKQKFDSLQNAGNNAELKLMINEIAAKLMTQFDLIDKTDLYTEEQIKTYTTQGGTPHLDGEYTVFGQVINGMDVVDKIAKLETDSNNRPLIDFRINTIEIIK
ncbi:MAG: Peptidyl-prolyl cis-trans isomerase [Candidatus Gottesmanbacteria bacterium GW2011_GWC2_42_8]|nr:MAG: Peptidyl-prolyl cis-trans isomerase [Candidatus Gottesmanbacteria bacterium GW2011_GWC2_42_8]